jgi:predicted RNase H-like HicB family nuclease
MSLLKNLRIKNPINFVVMKYSVFIQWSKEDQVYIALLPEWGKYARTHGESYEEALENAKEVLEDLIYGYEKLGKALPEQKILQFA